jgi:hypothetical protein
VLMVLSQCKALLVDGSVRKDRRSLAKKSGMVRDPRCEDRLDVMCIVTFNMAFCDA